MKNMELNFDTQSIAFKLASCFFNPTPDSINQRLIKVILRHFTALRKLLINYANSVCEIDFYNLQALLILERAGVDAPKPYQIRQIENILRAS